MNESVIPCVQGTPPTRPVTGPDTAMKRKRDTDRINFDGLCRLLKVDTWEKVDDRNIDCYGWDADATEEENQKAEDDARDELHNKYRDAVMFVAEKAFEEHGLDLVPVRELMPNGRPWRHKGWKPETAWEFRIKPKEDWKDAASHLRQTIDGMGPFYFGSLRNFLDSGPFTPREAVLQHIGWIPDWFEVYEGGKAAYRVERRLR